MEQRFGSDDTGALRRRFTEVADGSAERACVSFLAR